MSVWIPNPEIKKSRRLTRAEKEANRRLRGFVGKSLTAAMKGSRINHGIKYPDIRSAYDDERQLHLFSQTRYGRWTCG